MTQPAESLAPVTPDASAPSAARRRLLYAGVAGAAALGGAGFAWWKFQPHAVEPGAEHVHWSVPPPDHEDPGALDALVDDLEARIAFLLPVLGRP